MSQNGDTEKLTLNILHKIHGRSLSNDESSSESDSETETGTTFGTPRSDKSDFGTPRSDKSEFGTPRSEKNDSGTPRSISSEASTVTSPRANLLWDHGFDVAQNNSQSPNKRDAEWRHFNKTDDDKLRADRRLKIREIAERLHEINERGSPLQQDRQIKPQSELPDLIPSNMQGLQSIRSSQKTLKAFNDADTPWSVDDAEDRDSDESPPPLPSSSPPKLDLSLTNCFEDDFSDYIDKYSDPVNESEQSSVQNENEHDSTGCYYKPMATVNVINSSDEESSSAEGDISDRENDDAEEASVEVEYYDSTKSETDIRFSKMKEDVEAEFDFILQSLENDKDSQETYIERFANRRDRYGFILSPVVEAPSPTPSNFSNYSGYSGISCASPDPLGNFRMSPGPSRGSKHELDLSSLCVNTADWEPQQDHTVPIYQIVTAKKAFAFPEGYGWESGDDLLSPTGSVEWDTDNGGLRTPPVSTTSVSLTQFGTHITGWKGEPEVAIYEEPEDYDTDVTAEAEEEENNNDEDSETTIEDEHYSDNNDGHVKDTPFRNHKDTGKDSHLHLKDDTCEHSKREITQMMLSGHNGELNASQKPSRGWDNSDSEHEYENVDLIAKPANKLSQSVTNIMTDESVQTQLFVLDDEIKKVDNELKALRYNSKLKAEQLERDNEELGLTESENDDITKVKVSSLESSLNESTVGFSDEIAALNRDEGVINVELKERCRKPIPRNDYKTLENEINYELNESDEDAEDELSESEDENKAEDEFDVFSSKSRGKLNLSDTAYARKDDEVSVSELMSPRTAVLLSGAMLPEESNSSTFTSEEEVPGNVSPDPNMSSYGSSVKVRQYTSEDSADSSEEQKESRSIKGIENNNDTRKISFRKGKAHQRSEAISNKEEITKETAEAITIHSPLDFSVFDSKLDSINRDELRKSPRIFGRYYSEMDKEVLEKVRSQSCPAAMEVTQEDNIKKYTDETKHNHDRFKKYAMINGDTEDLESSFKNIEFTNPKVNTVPSETSKEFIDESSDEETRVQNNNESALFVNIRPENVKLAAGTIAAVTGKENFVHTEMQYNHGDITFDMKECSVDEKLISRSNDNMLENCLSNNMNSEHHIIHSNDRSNNMSSQEIGGKGISIIEQKQSSSKSKKSAPVRIKVGHLSRTGSARLKVKQGYVHELSEMFNKGNASDKVITEKEDFKKVPRKISFVERIPTPKFLTPNDNIVVVNEREDIPGTINSQGSLGFEVVQLANEIICTEETENDEDKQYEDDFTTSDSESGEKDSLDRDLKLYADRLRDIEDNDNAEKTYHISRNTVTQGKDTDGTKEFVPALDTLTEKGINLCSLPRDNDSNTNILLENSDSEIEEVIDGDIDLDQSEDEEFRQRYRLKEDSNDTQGHVSASPASDKVLHAQAADNSEHGFILLNQSDKKHGDNDNCNKEHSYLRTEELEDNNGDSSEVLNDSICSPLVTETRVATSIKNRRALLEQSSIVKEIPWKPLVLRKKEAEVRKLLPKKSESKPKKKSGYLYDLISRLNLDNDLKPPDDSSNNTKDSIAWDQNPSKYKSQTVSEKSKRSVSFVDNLLRGKNTDGEGCAINDTDKYESAEPVHFIEIKEQTISTAATETGEFGILDDEPVTAREHSQQRLQRVNACQVYTTDFEDPKNQIRYPFSLSRRLYGPYSRLKERETTLEDVNEHEKEGETSPLNLAELDTPRQQLVKTTYTATKEPLNSKPGMQENHSPPSPTCFDVNENTEMVDDNLPMHYEDTNLIPTDFNYSYYDVNSKSLRPTQQDIFNVGPKPITECRSNGPERISQDGENKFVNVKVQQTTNEAESNKQQTYSLKSAYYATGENEVILSKLYKYPECEILEDTREHENKGAVNKLDQGVDVDELALKNEENCSAMGVHIPHSVLNDETKQENVDMNNGLMSKRGRKVPLNSNRHGINYTVSSSTTQNVNSDVMSSGYAVEDDKQVKYGDNGSTPAAETHVRTSVVLQTPGYQHVLEDEKGKLRIWPYSDFEDSDKVPVTLHRAKRGINIPVSKGMSKKPSGNMTVIHSAAHSAERPENKMVQKFHSSSVLPANRSAGEMMKAHGESVQSILLQDADGNAVSEEELAAVLPKIAETISKMDGSNVEEILPGITQSITKLKNGGNLVITTMTRKLDEEEEGSSGRGSPTPDYPVLDVDDLEKSKIYLVQDSKGELFYVEDVTSDTQESAYFSSSRNTSESVSETGNSPTFQRISKINAVGQSGIKDSTAEEILNAMYGESDLREMTENEEEWSERTYEYDFPQRKNYSKDTFNSSYMVEEPTDTMPRMKSATTNEKYESSYQTSGGVPWVYDGGMSQSYSQVTQQNVFVDDANSVSAVSTQNAENTPAKTIERYTIEGEAVDYPVAPQPPVFVPPMAMQTDTSQYSLVKVDVTPKQKDEGVVTQIEAPKPEESKEKLIYKTVAHIQTADKKPAPKPPKYKIISSKATSEEEQETHMSFDETDYKFSTESVEYKMRPTTETQYFVRNTTKLEPQHFRSEKKIELSRKPEEKYRSQIEIKPPQPDVYEERSYTYDQMKSEMEQTDSSMRVVRGSYLIKNTLDGVDTALDDNINMFDGSFTLCKDNPLYKSDEDIYRKLEREKAENLRRQEKIHRELNPDITFETVDRFTKSKTVKQEPEKPRQSLYEMLMNSLATIDTTHIKQKLDVKHNAEDIYGDPRFINADGEYAYNPATNNFDTVREKVDLMIKDGKAFITVVVTAERVTPVDLEFNVWRKNQAIVTRTIEVDLLATKERRRLYYKVMEEPTGGSHGGYRAGPNETILDSEQTLKLFTKILGAADGEGDIEDIEIKTRAGQTTRPFSTGMDLLY